MAYSRVSDHGAMVFDAHRNDQYGRAIGKLVHPASVVLDLGAGLGLHGLMAASAGAARVYLVEPQPLVHAALDVARAGGLLDRVIVLQDRIEDIRLPEPVDLIVSVFTGNLLFSEDLLPSLFHARDHYLKPDGQMLPDRAQLWLAPLCAPQLHQKHVGRWQDPVRGLDFSAARRFAANEILWPRREEFRHTQRLGPGALMVDLDLATASSSDCNAASCCRVETSGLCHGLLGWIRIQLQTEWLSTDPDSPEVHWSPVLLPLDPPLPLVAGETLQMALQRPTRGDWTWTATAQAGSRRQSSFLSRADGARELARLAPANRPGLNARGQRALTILELLRQGLSNQAVAEALGKAEALEGSKALQEVQALARLFGGPR